MKREQAELCESSSELRQLRLLPVRQALAPLKIKTRPLVITREDSPIFVHLRKSLRENRRQWCRNEHTMPHVGGGMGMGTGWLKSIGTAS